MTTVRFKIDENRALKDISTEEFEALERAQDGEVRLYRLRPILARFVTDEAGVYIPHTLAMKQLGAIPLDEFMSDVFPAFFEALRGAAIPNMSGGSSRQHLEVSSQASESPIG